MRAVIILGLVIAGCGAAQEPPPPTSTVEAAPAPIERACFSGTSDNGVCHVFSADREPLSALATQCIRAGGHWLEACPTEGSVGTCAGPDGERAVYYGAGLGPDATRRACEAEGHTFTP